MSRTVSAWFHAFAERDSSMPLIQDICDFLDDFAPTDLAEDWDNVGLLAGDFQSTANRLMTCLTITPDSAKEAIDRGCDLIITHHPLPFQPIKKITTDQTSTRMLWDLIRAGIAIYSPHTGFDSAPHGINHSLATLAGITDPQPIVPSEDGEIQTGAGRIGLLEQPVPVAKLIDHLRESLVAGPVGLVGQLEQSVQKIAFACGSGGTFLAPARELGCEALVTGEASFHTCLEAEATGVQLILLGHYASERFALEQLAEELEQKFPGTEVWASQAESDPIKRV
ncbi:MAG: Nif3-like dinuclear metal center hexameric protein [Mariniblastus sp.]|nr:Nif3-like dinuclear metal center hexameric protein [Mariniblastus sp.]